MKLVLFDIDGTLLHDGGGGRAAFDAAFQNLFFVSEASAGVNTHGRTDPRISREAALKALGRELTARESHALHRRYVDLLPHHLASSQEFRLLDGVIELCESLHADSQILLGLQTGNLELAAEAKLSRANIGISSCAAALDRTAKIESTWYALQ